MTEFILSSLTMPAATLGKENPLPDIRHISDNHAHIDIDSTTVSEDEARYMGWGRINTILPYKVLDGYNRKKKPRAFKSIVLENDHLRATFLPELGGRLWSLFDKDAKRELLHVNPVFQPCNLALRNAWISGGVEWNVGIVGHTPFTVDEMVCQRVSMSDGTPVLRMFQYERVRRVFYRVDAFLPDGSTELFVRVRLDNATNEDTAIYWWSNMAVNETDQTRVIVPATSAFRYGYGGKLQKMPIPHVHIDYDKLASDGVRTDKPREGSIDIDISRPTEIPQAMDFFFDVEPKARPFITAIDEDGYGICQTSTGELRGRKLFVWGMNAGGRHWQEFLSQKGSAYIELQSGLARTQLEHLPMKGLESISWLESYGAIQVDPKKTQGSDWNKAVSEVSRALSASRPESALEEMHERVKNELDGQNGQVLNRGMGYARAEKALLGDSFHTAGLHLDGMREGSGEKPWIMLAKTGTLPNQDTLKEPSSYQIGERWESALENSIRLGKSDHWYGWYQLGVIKAAQDDEKGAREAFKASLDSAKNPWALYAMATLDRLAGNTNSACELLCEAAYEKPIRSLALEAMDCLASAEKYEELGHFIESLPKQLRMLGRVKTYEILYLMRTGRHKDAQKLLDGNIVLADVREGNVLLSNLWYECRSWKLYGQATDEDIARVRESETPPEHLDFRMN